MARSTATSDNRLLHDSSLRSFKWGVNHTTFCESCKTHKDFNDLSLDAGGMGYWGFLCSGCIKKLATSIRRFSPNNKAKTPLQVKTVDSNAIREIAYIPKNNILYVQFVSNPTVYYRYRPVPQGIFDQFIKAPSKGRFFQYTIRKNYPGTKVPAKEVQVILAADTATMRHLIDKAAIAAEEQYITDHLEGLN